VQPPLHYQPYQGYSAKPWYGYGWPRFGRRLRTRSDWYLDSEAPRTSWGQAPYWQRRGFARYPFWQRASDNRGSVYETRAVHRRFRHTARRLVQRHLEWLGPTTPLDLDALNDFPLSHHHVQSGDYLD
jgi:hypothetical protein